MDGEGGVVIVIEGQLDFKRAVVLPFDRSVEDEQPRHQPRRQRRPASPAVHTLENRPSRKCQSIARQPHQRMSEIDHLLQGRPQQALLTIVPWLCHPRPPTLMTRHLLPCFAATAIQNCNKSPPIPRVPAIAITLPIPIALVPSIGYGFFTDDPNDPVWRSRKYRSDSDHSKGS
jgi:hypothetical protein